MEKLSYRKIFQLHHGYSHSGVHVSTGWPIRTPGDIQYLTGGTSIVVLVLLDSVALLLLV